MPVQSWPLAYWPDGSLKWTGHAVDSTARADSFHLAPGTPAAPPRPVTVTRAGDELRLSNGLVDVRVARRGPVAVRSITRGGRTTARDGRLVLLLQDRPEDEDAPRRTEWTGVVESAEIEQSGPVRAVVRLTGRHRPDEGTHRGAGRRTVLPWVLRIQLGAGDASLRLTHHFTWDADAATDFVRGLGEGVEARPLCDVEPVLERVWAARAGLGFVGKHGLVITPGQGSYQILGEVVTTLSLVPDEPMAERCG